VFSVPSLLLSYILCFGAGAFDGIYLTGLVSVLLVLLLV